MRNKIARGLRLNKSYLESLNRIAALEQQLAAKDAEIAAAQAALREILWESQRLCQIYGINHSGYRGWLRDRIAALAETPAAPEGK